MKEAVKAIIIALVISALTVGANTVKDVEVLKESKQNMKEDVTEMKQDIKFIKRLLLKRSH